MEVRAIDLAESTEISDYCLFQGVIEIVRTIK